VRVFKYRLAFTDIPVAIPMPLGSRLLHVDVQEGDLGRSALYIWALVNPEEYSVNRIFIVCATGQEVREGARHVGTAMDGPFVWHVFEVPMA
jgi:hypothetical protein